MKAIMITVRLWWFYLTYKGIKTAEIRKRFAKDFKGKIYEYVSKTNWKKDLMKIPEEEREFFKQFVGKVGLCFECDKVEEIEYYEDYTCEEWDIGYQTEEMTNNAICFFSCLSDDQLDDYLQGKTGYAIHITNLEIFDEPKEIGEFGRVGYNFALISALNTINKSLRKYRVEDVQYEYQLTRAPQSWCYVEV